MAVIKEFSYDVNVKVLEGKGRRKRQIDHFRKTVKLKQGQSESSALDVNFHEDGIKAIKVTCVRDRDNAVKGIQNRTTQVKDKVMFSKEEYVEAVKVVVKEVAEKGAAAVFVVVDPGILVDIPVFVVGKVLMGDMERARAIEVSLQCEEVEGTPSEDSDSEDASRSSEEDSEVDSDDSDFEMDDCTDDGQVQESVKNMRREVSFRIESHHQSKNRLDPYPADVLIQTQSSTHTENEMFKRLNLTENSTFQLVKATNRNPEDMKGAIAYSTENDLGEVKGLVQCLASCTNQVAAVFVACDPEMSVDIPVFVLSPTSLSTLIQLDLNLQRGEEGATELRICPCPNKNDSLTTEEGNIGEDMQVRMPHSDIVGIGRTAMGTLDNDGTNEMTFSIGIKCSSPSGAFQSFNSTMNSAKMTPSEVNGRKSCSYQNVEAAEVEWSNEHRGITNKNNMKGRVIFSDYEEGSIIASIAREGAELGAVAIFASVTPTEISPIPVFVLEKARLDGIMLYPSVLVDLEPLCEDPSSRGAIVVEDEYADTVQKGTRKRKKRRKRRKHKKSKKGYHWEEESTKKKSVLSKVSGFASSVISKAVGLVAPFVPKSKSRLEAIFAHNCTWSVEDGLRSYCAALRVTEDASRDRQHVRDEFQQISIELNNHFEQQSYNVDILVLVYAIHVLRWGENMDPYNEFEDLRISVDLAVQSLVLDPNGSKLCDVLQQYSNLRADTCKDVRAYVLSCFNMLREGDWKGKLEVNDERILKSLWILVHHCGATFDWQQLIPLVDPTQFPVNEDCKLAQIIGLKQLNLLGLRVQTSIDDFCNVMNTMRMASTDPVLILFEKERAFLLPLLDSSYEVQKVNKSLDQFRFHDPDNTVQHKIDKWKNDVVSKIIAGNGGHTRDLAKLQQMLESIDVEHSYLDLYHQGIVKACKEMLQPHPYHHKPLPPVDAVRKALTKVPLCNLLASRDLYKSMASYTHTCLSEPGYVNSNKQKIALIEDVYTSLVRVQDVNSDTISSFLSKSLKRILYSCRLEFFQVASDKEDFFCNASDEDLVSIAAIAWEKTDITGNGYNLTKLPLSSIDSSMMLNIRNKLYDILCESFGCIERWTTFYDRMKPNANPTLKSILEEVFIHVIKRWNPDDFRKIASLSPDCLRVIHSFISVIKSTHEITSSTQVMIKTCSEWNQKYNSNRLPYDDMEDILHLHSDEKWKDIEGITGVKLAGETELQKSLKQIDFFLSSIQSHVHIKVQTVGEEGPTDRMPILKVFSKYQCDCKAGTVGGVLLDWQDFTSKVMEAKKNYHYDDFEHAANCLKEFRTNYMSEINIAHCMGGSDCMLFYNEIGFFQNWVPVSIEMFLQKVSNAEQNLRSLLTCSGEDPCARIKEAFEFLKGENRDLWDEIKKLSLCPELRMDKTDVSQFHLLLSLVTISLPLRIFVECCRQLHFKFIHDDESFGRLSQISNLLDTSDGTNLATKDARNVAVQILGTVISPHDAAGMKEEEFIQDLVPIFTGLGYLSSTSDVWTLVREMKWFGEDGRKRFNEEYMNVTNKFLFSDSETYESNILDALDPVVRFISYLGSLLGECSFKEFFRKVKDSDELLAENISTTKRNMQLVQENVSNIREWFDSGVDDMLAIFSRFDQVWKTGQYTIRDNQLCLEYLASEKSTAFIDTADLAKFVQQLGFVQQENQHLSSQISIFIDVHQVLVDFVMKCAQAAAIGYECNLLECSFPYSVQNTVISTRVLLDKATKMLEDCDSWLQTIQENAPLSLLYWTEDLRIVYDILMGVCERGIDEPFDMLLPKLAALIPHEMNKTFHNGISNMTRECLVQFISSNRDSCWLMQISEFLENWYLVFSGEQRFIPVECNQKGGSFLHSFESDENQKPLMLLSALLYIFKGGLPKSYEVLDGTLPCTKLKMRTFLARVKAFPTSSFVVLNVQDLTGDLQEYLVHFMSHTNQCNHNLHCVQFSDTILHSSPWVEQVIWNERRLRQSDLTAFNSQIVDGLFVDRMVVVLGSSGSGKTRWIRNEIATLQHQDDQMIHTISLSLHEGTNIHSLLESLKKIPFSESSKAAIHVSFLVPLNDSCERDWVKSLNYFFNMLLLTRSVYDPITGETLFLGWQRYQFFVELQGVDVIDRRRESLKAIAENALSASIPILAYCSEFRTPPEAYCIDEKTRCVCTYLRALKDGTIDRKFDPTPAVKQLMFVIDKSGSMAGSQMNVAIDNALKIFDSHIRIGDVFGTLLFDKRTSISIPLQEVTEENINILRNQIDRSRKAGGGTEMFPTLRHALVDLGRGINGCDSWIICLTDGQSGNLQMEEFRQDLCSSPSNLHVMIIGVNLHDEYQAYLRDICAKFGSMQTQGAFFASQANVGSLNDAFQSVAASIPVSKTFELDGVLTDEDCTKLIQEYLPDSVPKHDMMRKKFWIEFLYRRVKVFDGNEHFNYNETYDHLGSSLMSIMLYEADRLLSPAHNRNWKESNHEQLIYDFRTPDAPEFRLVCTAPDLMNEASIERYTSLDLPGFFIPTTEQIKTRECLDLYLSQALNIPLIKCEDGAQRLSCIDENRFVLTLDFTMKILNMHERVACHVPCIIEGETGVSKTALTLMYSILMNSSLTEQARKDTKDALIAVKEELTNQGFIDDHTDKDKNPLVAIHSALVDATDGTKTNSTAIGKALHRLLLQCCDDRSCVFKEVSNDLSIGEESIFEFLQWFSNSTLEQTFFELNVDASLEESEVRDFFRDVCKIAKKVAKSGATVVVFLDEFNTSSIMGLFKEIIIDRSFCGERLESNVAVVAACNPAGRQSLSVGLSRESDLAKEWASGHYQVNKLPKSMESLKWNYGALNPEQEKEFVWRRIEMLDKSLPFHLVGELTEIITTSQEAIRSFAATDIYRGLERISSCFENHDQKRVEATNRARSAVSLRDIQRVFNLFQFLTAEFPITHGNNREAMLLTIAIVYYFKLDRDSRLLFLDELSTSLKNPCLKKEFLSLLDRSMMTVVKQTVIPDGIALTDGLKENIFMILVCSLSCTPLVIVGPPGSSKTLSVNILDFNTNGKESPSEWYRQLSRLDTFHYQCSKTSTSKEVASVFNKAIQRQLKVDPKKRKCLVFMDEAGLPEEEKESLKVLHYYLEGHMSSKASVAFVAITNHVLDAAKSNRCVSLLRQEPDEDEMTQVAEGVLFSSGKKSQTLVQVRLVDHILPRKQFASLLCSAYRKLLSLEGYDFETFYGLRDFIYFLQHIRQACDTDEVFMMISLNVLVEALERNFNGISSRDFNILLHAFLQQCGIGCKNEIIVRDTIDVVRSALNPGCPFKARYALVIDESDDDSIMRILQSEGLLQASKRSLFKLSNMPENMEMEQMNLVSRVKFAAQQGRDTIILSQTDSVNESFYDLFNQNFRRVPNRDGEECLYANIAVGGVSRRSRVSQSFRCVVHVRSVDLEFAPAPFLNRFEKYRLSIVELLFCKLERSPFLSRVATRAQNQIRIFSSIISLCAFVHGQTTETLFLDLFKQAPILQKEHIDIKPCVFSGNSFSEYIQTFSREIIGIDVSLEELEHLYKYGLHFLPMHQATMLQELIKKEELSNRHNILEALNECLFREPRGGLAMLIERLIEMLITRAVLARLLHLASPEEMFKKRDSLPSDLIDEYFQQEHFALKPFVQSVSTKASAHEIQKYIVHTRSNGQVMGIPTFRVEEEQSQKLQFVQTFIHQNPECVMIEHLNSLKNESTLRSTIDTWCMNDSIWLLVVVVDMSDQVSIERVNFLRCCIDQIVAKKKKTFISILHYPTSAFSANKFYPALFLDNWEHIYLDTIGDKEGLSIEMKNLVRKTCYINMNEQFDIGKMTRKIMADAIKSFAHLSIIYSEQLQPDLSDDIAKFQAKYEFLSSILSTKIDKTSMEDHLACRFVDIWSNDNLSKVLHRATWSLENGTSQLGLTSCLKSIMQDVMGTFMLNFLSQGNEWKNFDLLLSSPCRSKETDHLFLSILSSLPPLPFEEMLLHKADSTKKRKQLPDTKDLQAKFPFFSLINSLLDEVVESVFQNIPQEGDASSVIVTCTTSRLMQRAMTLLEDRRNENFGGIALETIQSVIGVENLYHSYMEQFLSWILLCSPTSSAAQWFKDKLQTEALQNPLNRHNLLLIHITARKYEMELMRLKSFCNQVPLWDRAMATAQMKDLAFEEDNKTMPAFDGSGFIDATTEWFVGNIHEILVNEVECTWMDLFPMFKHTISDVLGDDTITNIIVVHKLRLLSFLYTLKANETFPSQALEDCIKSIYDFDKASFLPNLDTKMETFIKLFDDAKQSEEIKVKCVIDLLQQFFSTQWLSNVGMYWEDDLTFMVKYLERVGDHSMLLKLARNACTFGILSENQNGNKAQIHDDVLNLSLSRLKVIDSLLSCTELSVFSADGSRQKLPHFIPQFAQSLEHFYDVKNLSQTNNDDDVDLFFSNYENNFSGILSEVVFQIVLEKIITLTEGQTSDQLLLAFLKNIHDECNLTRQEQTRLRRTGTDPYNCSGVNHHTGTALSVMIIGSRLLCFLLRVAYEMARGFPVAALEGSYSDMGKEVLRQIMCIPNARFQEIFMLHIVNIGGESRLRSLLCDDGSLLGVLDWTEEWRGGLPSIRGGIEEALAIAEHKLYEVETEEQKKSTEMRLCPHCGQPFLLLEANCGEFVCGRADTHVTPQNGPLGCGNQFRLAEAQYYNIDDARLMPLRYAVAEEKKKLQQHQSKSRVWSWMWEARLPILSSTMTSDHDFFTPLSIAVTSIGKDSDIIRHVADSKEKASTFQMLPQLIEIYIWLHSTFSSIISPEQATSMRIGDIMKKELLCKRFDSIHVEHLLLVWENVRGSLNKHLTFCDFKVNWDCETLEVPFKKIENASLMMLLSAFQHPTDGYDYLFVIINQIVGQFNEFMRKLHARTAQKTNLDCQPIHPRSLLSRSPAGLSLNALKFISSPDLPSMVESFRVHLEDEYDVRGLENGILDELSRCHFIIGNPLSQLRTQFRFREDASLQSIDASKAGLQSSVGTFFVHHQDLQLFEDCQRSLEEGSLEPSNDLKQTFMAKFHQLGYEELRSVLTGVMNAVNAFSFATNQTLDGHISAEYSLQALGFPQLSEPQTKLIVSLKPNQLAELVTYAGYQLASEAYNFLVLPISMNSDISCADRDKLRKNIGELVKMNGKEEVLKALREFRNDILHLYQLQIRDHCVSSNDGMKQFLETNNFCDDSDVIFSALPNPITVRNYIPLQQELHQLTLQMMTENDAFHIITESTLPEPCTGFSKPTRGKCWLFQSIHSSGGEAIASDDDDDVSMSTRKDEGNELWFEGGMIHIEHEGSIGVENDEHISSCTSFEGRCSTGCNSLSKNRPDHGSISNDEDMSISSSPNQNESMKKFESMSIDDDGDISISNEAGDMHHTGSAADSSHSSNESSEDSFSANDTDNYRTSMDNAHVTEGMDKKPPQAEPVHSVAHKLDYLDDNAIKSMAKTMVKHFMEHPDEESLFQTMDEIKEYPGATKGIVHACIHSGLLCNDDERNVIITIVSKLFNNEKITSNDITEPFGDMFRIMDTMITISCPRALEYMGDMNAEFLHNNVLDVTWLCVKFHQLEDESSSEDDRMHLLIPQMIEQCIKSFISRFNLEEAKVHFASVSSKLLLTGLLGRETWNSITKSTGLM